MIALLATALLAATLPTDQQLTDKLAAKLSAKPTGHTGHGLAVIRDRLRGLVTNRETNEIFDELRRMPPDEWLATLDALTREPWKQKKNLSLFDKFLRRGIEERNKFLVEFADQVNVKLELGLPTYAELLQHQSKRKSRREVREISKAIFRYFDLKEKMGVTGVVRQIPEMGLVGATVVAAIATAPFWLPIYIIYLVYPESQNGR